MYIIQYSKLYNIDLHMYTYLSVKILRDVPFSFFFLGYPHLPSSDNPGTNQVDVIDGAIPAREHCALDATDGQRCYGEYVGHKDLSYGDAQI